MFVRLQKACTVLPASGFTPSSYQFQHDGTLWSRMEFGHPFGITSMRAMIVAHSKDLVERLRSCLERRIIANARSDDSPRTSIQTVGQARPSRLHETLQTLFCDP